MKRELPRNSDGKKMYPVCSWERNQHKLYNANDRIRVAIIEAREAGEDTSDLYESLDRLERAMDAFESHVIEGTVYATWADRNLIMEFVAAYNARH